MGGNCRPTANTLHYKISDKQTELNLPFFEIKKEIKKKEKKMNVESEEKENSERVKEWKEVEEEKEEVEEEKEDRKYKFWDLEYIHIWKWIISYAKFPVGSAWEIIHQ